MTNPEEVEIPRDFIYSFQIVAPVKNQFRPLRPGSFKLELEVLPKAGDAPEIDHVGEIYAGVVGDLVIEGLHQPEQSDQHKLEA